MIKKFFIFMCLVIILIVGSTNIDAKVDVIKEKAVTNPIYYWKIEGKSVNKTINGGWRYDLIGKGPCDLNINSSMTVNRNVSNSISGSYPIGIGSISAYLGVSINKSFTHGTSYILKVPKGKKQQIMYRPIYKQYKVSQRQWVKTGTLEAKTKNVKYAYVNVFVYWEYSYKNV